MNEYGEILWLLVQARV